jgi:hypothetical protein
VDDPARLENACAEMHRGFESHSLRHKQRRLLIRAFFSVPELCFASTMSDYASVASTWRHSEERSDEESRSWSAGCPDFTRNETLRFAQGDITSNVTLSSLQ